LSLNFFEPSHADEAQPATLKRVGWSITRGVLLGMGLAALVFAYAWTPNLFDRPVFRSFIDFLPFLLMVWAFELWLWAPLERAPTQRPIFVPVRVASVVIFIASVLYVLWRLSETTLQPWAQIRPDFVTLVAVCGIVGVVALRGGFRLLARERARISMWFAAAAAVWLSGEWAVKLGVVIDGGSDPRVNLAYMILIVAGVLGATGVLALMDWRIRRRERAGAEGERLPDETV
jgi:hypothetical protein